MQLPAQEAQGKVQENASRSDQTGREGFGAATAGVEYSNTTSTNHAQCSQQKQTAFPQERTRRLLRQVRAPQSQRLNAAEVLPVPLPVFGLKRVHLSATLTQPQTQTQTQPQTQRPLFFLLLFSSLLFSSLLFSSFPSLGGGDWHIRHFGPAR